MSRFSPPRCPYRSCPSNRSRRGSFTWRRRGHYKRRCDGRIVQRFDCGFCGRRFSTQSFRLDYRLRRLNVSRPLFYDFVSKVTHRQSARRHGVSRSTVEHRFLLLADQAHRLHLRTLARARSCSGVFQFDELETYETDRRLKPVTVPVLIHRHSYFVVSANTAPLASRGKLRPRDRKRLEVLRKREGRRRSGSLPAVVRSLRAAALLTKGLPVHFQTDRKPTYVRAIQRVLPGSMHERYSSKLRRNYRNPLFPINHTLAMLRDGVSRLVRRTWAGSKKRSRLRRHLRLWLMWRNYLRGVTVRAPGVTPAMSLGLDEAPWDLGVALRWQARFQELARVH